jgi:para-nitrobenzyl esterase
MRKSIHVVVLSVLFAGAMPVVTAPALGAEAAAAPAARYSVSATLVGALLDDPAANAVLKKMIPSVYANEMFQTQGRDLTLQAIQQYEPEALSDANLAKLQAELDKLPARDKTPAKG